MPDLASIIREAAAKHGVSPETLLRIAQIESNMDPNAANKDSSARGVFQFIDKTWKAYGKGQDVLDPVANADAGARFVRDNANTLRTQLGREPAPWELYLAHQQGAGGAGSLLANPSARAVDVTSPDAIRLNAGHTGMSAGDFANLWKAKFEGIAVPGPTTGGPGKDLIASAATPAAAGFQPQRRQDLLLGSLFDNAAAPMLQKPQEPLVQRRKKSVGDQIGDLGQPVRLSS